MKQKEKILENIGKPRKLREFLKYLGMPNKTLISSFNAMKDNTLIFDTRSISTVFKDFLSKLEESHLNKLPNPPDKYNLESFINHYSSFTITDDFCLNNTSENKFLKMIKKLRFLRLSVEASFPEVFREMELRFYQGFISEVCNLSIFRWVFLDTCKVAKLEPIYKKGKKADLFGGYRPISLLPIISKVIERTVHDQTNTFLSENNILYNFQSGFRQNHLTNLCFSHLTKKILKGFDEDLLTEMILIDLQKAFGTVNRKVLLRKLKGTLMQI